MERNVLVASAKLVADVLAIIVTSPMALLCGLERRLVPGAEGIFHFCTQLLALAPGLPGVCLRRGFYRLSLDACHADCHIGFGAMFTHRQAIVERGVYIGAWALVGSSHLKEGTSIGSRASLLSGTDLHEYDRGTWGPYDHRKLRQIELGPHAMVGEGAIVIADVGPSAMVAAGAVVANKVAARVVVAGNPARFVRHLEVVHPEPAPPGVES